MDIITGSAVTTDAARVIRRLCKHWRHKYEVRFDETTGAIHLPDALVTLRAEPEGLSVTLENAAAEVPRRLMGVVGEHLQRMAADPAFVVRWNDPPGA
jgi:hypothetical protein